MAIRSPVRLDARSPAYMAGPRELQPVEQARGEKLNWAAVKEVVRCMILFAPLVWTQLGGRNPGVALFLGTGLAIYLSGSITNLVAVIGRTASIWGAIVVLLVFQLFMDERGLTSGVTTWAFAMSYAICAGAVLSESISRYGIKPALHSILLTGMITTCIALLVIRTQGVETFLRFSATGERSQIDDEGLVLWRFFNTGNFLFWVALLTINSACGIGCLVTHIGNRMKLLYCVSIVLACYCNYTTATRTVVLLIGITFGIFAFVSVIHPQTTLRRRLTLGMGLSMLLLVVAVTVLNRFSYETLVLRIGQTLDDSRFFYWRHALLAIADYPFGGAAEHFYAAHWAHNHVLDVALNYTVVAGLAVSWVYGVVLWRIVRVMMTNPIGFGYVAWFVLVVGNTLAAMTLPPQQALFIFVVLSGVAFTARVGPPAGMRDSRPGPGPS